MSEMYVVIYSLLSNRIIYRVCQKWRNKYFYFLLFPPHLMMHSKFPDCAMRHTADQSGGVTDFGITHASFMLTSSNFTCTLKQVYWLKSVHRICKSECAIYSRILEVFDGKSQKCYKKKCRSIV